MILIQNRQSPKFKAGLGHGSGPEEIHDSAFSVTLSRAVSTRMLTNRVN